MSKLIDLAKRLYATPTGYRLFWTGVQLGAGAVVVALGADPLVGGIVTLVATFVTSIAREHLSKPDA